MSFFPPNLYEQHSEYWKTNFVIKLEHLKCTNKWRKLKQWLQRGETDRVWESRLATHPASLCPSSSCALNDTVIIVCNGFCQWHMREGWSCPCLFSTWPNITLSPKWLLSKTFSGVQCGAPSRENTFLLWASATLSEAGGPLLFAWLDRLVMWFLL